MLVVKIMSFIAVLLFFVFTTVLAISVIERLKTYIRGFKDEG